MVGLRRPLPAVDGPQAREALSGLAGGLGAHAVECAMGDFTSLARGKRVSAADFASLGGCKLPSVILGLTLTAGEPAALFGPMLPKSYVDMMLVPDLQTLAPQPGRPGEAQVICEPTGRWASSRYGRDVDAAEFSPRAALRAVLDSYAQAGLEVLAAPELELFLLSRTQNAHGEYVLDSARATAGAMVRESACESFSLERASHFNAYFDALYEACEALGIPISGHAHEAAFAQYEINLSPGDPLSQADAVFRLKRVARELAVQHGFIASFAPKPFLKEPGTGMHWHFSVQRKGEGHWPHVFSLPTGESTPALRHFIAGIQAEAAGAMALFAPYDMSFDRIRLSNASPSHASWGDDDRSLALRIPHSSPQARRVELRLPGGDANPYLTVASALGLGLAGLQAGQEPVSGAHDQLALPRSLPDALDSLERSHPLREILGSPLTDAYIAIKRHEHAERSALADPRQQWDMTHLIELA